MKTIPRALICSLLAAGWSVVLACISAFAADAGSLTVHPAKPMPAGETAGARPYEMVRAGRKPPHTPLVSFDSLAGWQVECADGAVAELFGSQKQCVWESPVARLVYRGTSNKSTIVLRPPQPLAVADPVSATTIWMYGNNWAWVPDPTTPRVTVSLLLLDREGKSESVQLAQVGWKEWWLVHKVLPPALLERKPLRLAGLRIAGAANKEDRELYFEDLAFFQETTLPLTFQPRPQRGVDPFPGQSPGANTGPGRLPFPTRAETILPENHTKDFTTTVRPGRNQVGWDSVPTGSGQSPDLRKRAQDNGTRRVNDAAAAGTAWRFTYRDSGTLLEYDLKPGTRFWEPVAVTLNKAPLAKALAEAGPKFSAEPTDWRLVQSQAVGKEVQASWQGTVGGVSVTVQSTVRLWQKSLVVDCTCTGGLATELSYGRLDNVAAPELLLLPFMNYGGHHLNVLMSKGPVPYFASVWMDWYRSNASVPYALDKVEGDKVYLNGGVRYLPKTDQRRNDLCERFFVTFSPVFEETLPTIPNPPAKRGREAATRLWQESWGPKNYDEEHARSKKLRAYGIERLTQCNHEITWRDGGESFTFREMAAPGKGGDEALQRYVAAQRTLGWRSGLYTNYTDFAPVNANWGIDRVMRRSDGNLVTAWPRCYSPKALFAVEMDRRLAPLIQKKFNTNAAYTDVHTSVAPWDRVDFDARVPGAGTFAATFYAYGELLLHDQDVYDGHCWSEGNHQWLYSGLCAGNYGLAYSGLRLWKYPYLPHFDLLQMHPLTVDIGVPWTSQFFTGKDGWQKPENIVTSIDQFLAATIAYGHIGWLVEETHGLRQTCRSYYMLQPLQARYAMQKPVEIRYGTERGTVSSSEAFVSGDWRRSQLFIRYPQGLLVWVNGHADQSWRVEHEGVAHDLPPFGWLAVGADGFHEASEAVEGKRYDRAGAPECVYLDGRGVWRECDGVAAAGSVAVRRGQDGRGLSIITIEGVERLVIGKPRGKFGPDDVRTALGAAAESKAIAVRAFDVQGQDLGAAAVQRAAAGWEVRPPPSTVRLEVRIIP